MMMTTATTTSTTVLWGLLLTVGWRLLLPIGSTIGGRRLWLTRGRIRVHVRVGGAAGVLWCAHLGLRFHGRVVLLQGGEGREC
jgi:hypothetical protein